MIKRLNTIIDLIDRKQYHLLQQEADALEWFSDNNQYQELISALRKKNYAVAREQASSLARESSEVSQSGNLDITGLETVRSMLETQLLVLSHRKTEAERTITQFRLRYNLEIAMILGEILRIRVKIAELERDENPDKAGNFQQANADYKRFSKSWKHIPSKAIRKLGDDEKRRMQAAYRQASKMCHPDLVDPDMQEQARKVFIELNRAYNKNQIEKVEEILELLQNGIYQFQPATSHEEKKQLEVRIRHLRNETEILKNDLDHILSSETFQSIQRIENWDTYFNETKSRLTAELENLKMSYEQQTSKAG